ncbi:MAG TPA: Asp-tRNA(Asn)/Glu-tRNA(Gln) amidotransferase subunit GatA [Trueperaceae bacterium]
MGEEAGHAGMTAQEIAQAVRSGRLSAGEVVEAALARARAAEDLNFLITLDEAGARAAAGRLDALLRSGGDPGPLAGVPVVVKDNILTEGLLTTAASRSLASFVPPLDATVVARLRRAGAVIIGKSNMDEFGMGSSNENSAFGAARNPWDRSRVPGGSSGGSAVAVAAGVVPLALGTDTGGSVRQPAAFCGVVGFKPTYGVLSRFGVIAFASSLDQVGVLGRSGSDVELAMMALAGPDPRDATSLPDNAFGTRQANGLEGVRIGVVTELSGEGNDPEVLEALGGTVAALEGLGAEVEEAELPASRYGIPTYYLVATAEASSNLSRYDGITYSRRIGENARGQAAVTMMSRGLTLGSEVRRRILMGTYALSAGYYDAYYGKALRVRRLISDDFERAFESFDLLLTPTTPGPAFPIGERSEDPLSMYLTDIDTCLPSLAGLPAISVPAGFTDQGLPCGVQLIAPPLGDSRLLRVAKALEEKAGAGFAPLAG